MEYEIERFSWFDTVEFQGKRQNIWKYKRAIEGHKFLLVEAIISGEDMKAGAQLFFQVYDGHVYSHWGSFPQIFDQATLGLANLIYYNAHTSLNLHNWECKEFTMSMRLDNDEANRRFNAIVWYYQIPMSKLEKFEYAVKQPRYKIRHGGPRTLDRFED
ncbi:hypothetical protein ES705_39231 [subsurface metagenome]